MSSERSMVSVALTRLRGAIWSAGCLSFVLNALMLTGPLFMLQVYDRVLASGSVPTLVALGVLVCFLYLFFGVLEGIRSRLLSRMGQRLDAQLSAAAFELSSRVPLTLGPKSAKVRPVQDIDALRQFVSGPGPAAIFDLPWMPLYLGVVFLFHSVLGLVAVAGALLICVLIALNEIASRKPAAEASREASRRAALVEAGRRNAEAVQAMGMRTALSGHWTAANDRYLESQRKAFDRTGGFGAAIKAFRFLLQSAILGVGAWLAIAQEITPGVMIAASILTSRALAPVEQAVGHWRGFVSARQALARLREMLPGIAAPAARLELPHPEQELRLEGLACAPAGLRVPFVMDASFTLTAGDGLGVIGASGSGKSTLARAIVGVVPALKGAVRLDGAELSQWPDREISRFIGYLPQEIQLFDGTIAENIARFDPEAQDADIIEAARLADVHDLIVGLPDGYNMQIGGAGLVLSGGQRQRIALARALYRNPFLVVLDEPNSNLDSEGEAALTRAVTQMRARGSIVIVIAHRPSAIAAVDTLLFMTDGRVSAYGPKAEVMKQSDKALSLSIRRHVLAGLALIAFLVGGAGAWAAYSEIAGAVVAIGTVVVESDVKQVQHQEGGIVHEIRVRDGDLVAAGDLLLRLDDTVTRANLAVVTKQLMELGARQARLLAEQSGAEEVTFAAADYEGETGAPSLRREIEASQQALFDARRAALAGRKKQLGEQIVQFERQIEGLEAQRDGKSEEIALIEEELSDLQGLLDKKLVAKTRVTALRRDRARLVGERGGFIAQIAQAREAISERRIQILQLKEERRADVLEELQDVRGRIAQLEEQQIAARDQLRRVEIRAPRTGIVHQSAVHTIGGILAGGEVAMLIVPREDVLVVEAQIAPVNIDQIGPGQKARVRFPSFDQRTTPEVEATLVTVSPDLSRDDTTGLTFYTTRLTISENELARLEGKALLPGMPVEVFVTTQSRSVLSYLVKPMSDQITHAFRER
eukprot:jgi/Tetstr1/423768/TSEL_001409.t1